MKTTSIIQDLFFKLSQGNPGALTALTELLKRENSITQILKFDELDIKGPLIWICYKDLCNYDSDLLYDHLKHDTLTYAIALKRSEDPKFKKIWDYHQEIRNPTSRDS